METYLMEIIVNGKRKPWVSLSISFDNVVCLAFGLCDPYALYTVTYAHGEDNSSGSLVRGDKVPSVMNMIFNVSITDKS